MDLKITEFLTRRGFKEIDTGDLTTIMADGIKTPDTDIIIVFSHDIIPDKILDNPSSPSSNSLFRRFLNVGHTIIWLGDVLAYYVGFPGKGTKPLPQPQTITGLIGITPPTRVDDRLVLVKPTLWGLLLGVKLWMGKRPHQIKVSPGVNLIPLAVSREGMHGYVYSPTPLASALSGIVRLYDFPITSDALSDEMLESIFNIDVRKSLRDNVITLTRCFDILRTEVDEKLGEKLDRIFEEIKKLKAEVEFFRVKIRSL